jgi:hypothetical protein
MEQRPLRLGDNVDDYCPRERRVTNHAIVAIVGDSVRQTRCSTCDTEHEFKGARMPRKSVKPAGDAAGVLVTPRAVPAPVESVPVVEPVAPVAPVVPIAAAAPVTPIAEAAPVAEETPREPENGASEGWGLHRRLIRATLPKVEGTEPAPRPIPEFTMHQRQPARGFHGRGFRHGHNNSGHQGNGFRANQGNGTPFRDGEADGNRPPQPGGGKPGRRRRRRRR